MDAHLDDPQVRRQGIYRIVEWDGFGPVRVVRYPAEFGSAGRVGSVQPPPEVGRDNRELLG